MNIIDEINVQMKKQGIVKGKLSRLADLAPVNLNDILAGNVSPTLRSMEAIAKALGCKIVLRAK